MTSPLCRFRNISLKRALRPSLASDWLHELRTCTWSSILSIPIYLDRARAHFVQFSEKEWMDIIEKKQNLLRAHMATCHRMHVHGHVALAISDWSLERAERKEKKAVKKRKEKEDMSPSFLAWKNIFRKNMWKE